MACGGCKNKAKRLAAQRVAAAKRASRRTLAADRNMPGNRSNAAYAKEYAAFLKKKD